MGSNDQETEEDRLLAVGFNLFIWNIKSLLNIYKHFFHKSSQSQLTFLSGPSYCEDD